MRTGCGLQTMLLLQFLPTSSRIQDEYGVNFCVVKNTRAYLPGGEEPAQVLMHEA